MTPSHLCAKLQVNYLLLAPNSKEIHRMSVVRVLVVDDTQEWRDFISHLLLKDERFEIVGKAHDGTHAIRLTEQTKPTVVLLDIRMPRMNGLEAAKRIRAIEPRALIIFLTGESDRDVVVAAFEVGASGYVLKVNASRDLLLAIDAAIDGNRFASSGLLESDTIEKRFIDQNRGSSSDSRRGSRTTFSYAKVWC